MDLFTAIQSRHTSRHLNGKPVLKSDLEKIVDAGHLAPTGYNIQPWHFIAVTDKEYIREISKADEWVADAGAVILIVMNPTASDFITEDASAAIVTMLLAATALGYSGCWVEGDLVPFEKEFKKLFNIPDQYRLFAMVPLGTRAGEVEPKPKKPIEEVLHWETF